MSIVIIGQVKQNTECSNIARNLVLKLGLPEEAPGICVTIACGSGLLSIEEGVEFIGNGFAEVILAGGVESMSGGEYFLSYKANQAFDTGPVQLLDSIVAGGPGQPPWSVTATSPWASPPRTWWRCINISAPGTGPVRSEKPGAGPESHR